MPASTSCKRRARRKIIVIGTLSLCTSPPSDDNYRKLAMMRAQQIADIAVVVGPGSNLAFLHSAKPERAESPGAHSGIVLGCRQSTSISTVLAGDLVLLKGTNKLDHLLNRIMARNDVPSVAGATTVL